MQTDGNLRRDELIQAAAADDDDNGADGDANEADGDDDNYN